MPREAVQGAAAGYRRLLGYGLDLGVAGAVGVATGWVLGRYAGPLTSFLIAAAAGGGTGAGLWARRSRRPQPLVDALHAAAGGALGVYLGERWFGMGQP